ncbi:hypothetical protein JOC26_000051 [Sporohalobacter salinus]|nr:hypothetical protein [Sporohalobacter salinus]
MFDLRNRASTEIRLLNYNFIINNYLAEGKCYRK